MTSRATLRNQTLFWLMSLVVFIGLIALFKSILLPFVLGIVIAYFLNPLIEGMDRWSDKLSRTGAALIILGGFFLAVTLGMIVLVPILVHEISDLTDELPSLIDKASALFDPLIDKAQIYFGDDVISDWRTMVSDHASKAGNMAGSVASGLLAGSLAVIDFATLIIITPVMAYYMMKEWPHITSTVEGLMPRDNKKTIMSLVKEIDVKLSSFIRGQLTVVLILAIGYAIALSLAGLKFGLLIGICAGLLCIIPMVGSIAGLFVAVAVALIQTSGNFAYAGIIAAIFIAGQTIEGYFLTPKLVGDSVGLHPLWVIFALMAGGSLFGIVGMLIAVPVAAIASVLIAFGTAQYKKSKYYKAHAPLKKKKTIKAKPAKK